MYIFVVYGISVTYGLYGCYGGGRVCLDSFCVGFVCGVGVRWLEVGFGALLVDTTMLYAYIHIYIYTYIDININIDVVWYNIWIYYYIYIHTLSLLYQDVMHHVAYIQHHL